MARELNETKLAEMNALVDAEVRRVASKNDPFSSPHEGWGILYEEVDELWDEVKKKKKVRNPQLMREEAMQIAAAAIRFMHDLT
jgi:hypothetical protein